MSLRDEVETTLRVWDKYESDRGTAHTIDYDCYPMGDDPDPVRSRLEIYYRLSRLGDNAKQKDNSRLLRGIEAHLAYLRAMLGEHVPFDQYIRATQGCGTDGWPDEYVTKCGELVRSILESQGIGWHPQTEFELERSESPLDVTDAPGAIRDAAAELEPVVRAAIGASASYELTIDTVDIDAYWSYWLDGAGQHARLRINTRRARFTKVRARQFALHEILGHALQCACLSARCAEEDVPWVRVLSVHAPQQVVSEGIAQALPLFVTPDDEALITRVRLDHYLQLVRAEIHLALNSGSTIDECTEHARSRVPFWTDSTISDLLTDRGADPLLRSYLWSYPAGLDWFASLANAPATVAREVLHAAYREPLTPDDLVRLWPAGPPIGGPGGA